MAGFWDNVSAIKQQQNAAALAQQNAQIDKAAKFWERVDGIKALEQERNGAYHEFMNAIGNNPDVPVPYSMMPGNTPTELPTFVPNSPTAAQTPRPLTTAKTVADVPYTPATFDYLNADLAKYYGMSKSTAYQEALENTAYQRAMKDMKAAGLNPAVMFGAGRANGAGSNVYPSSGGSGGYSRRSGGSSKSKSGSDDLFSPEMYGAISAIGGLIGIATTKKPDGFWIGSSVSQGAMQLLNWTHKNG